MCQKNFILALDDFDLDIVEKCKKEGIKFYWSYPVTTFYTLHALKKLGAEYALIDSPLTHSIINAANVGIKLRVVPNVAYYAIVPREDGVLGSWIRPEDLDLYNPYIVAIEFEDCDIKKEQALYRIYMEQKAWPGNLETIITNLNYPGVNRMIPQDLAIKRMTCGQRCLLGAHCQLCYRYLNLANPELLKQYKKDN